MNAPRDLDVDQVKHLVTLVAVDEPDGDQIADWLEAYVHSDLDAFVVMFTLAKTMNALALILAERAGAHRVLSMPHSAIHGGTPSPLQQIAAAGTNGDGDTLDILIRTHLRDHTVEENARLLTHLALGPFRELARMVMRGTS